MKLAALVFAVVLTAGAAEDPAALAARAKQDIGEGRFQEAAEIYAGLVRALPSDAGLKLNLGLALHSAGRSREAVAPLEAAVRLNPELAPAWMLLGMAHLKLGEPAAAVTPLERAVQLQPGNRIALLELADAYYTLGRAEQAVAHFRRLTELAPDQPKAWQGLGLSHLALSRRAFDRLEAAAPGSSWWYALLGRSRARQQQYRTAFYFYRKAMAAKPELAGLHEAIAGIYEATGHPDWAAVERKREAPVKAVPAGAGTPGWWYGQAIENEQRAGEAFARLAALPPSAEVHELLGLAYRTQGRHLDSAREFGEALKFHPGDRRLEKQAAESLWRNQDYDAAGKRLQALLAAEPDSALLNFEYGDVLLSLQQPERAIPYLEKAVRTDPRLLPARASLGRALLRAGRAREAVPQLQAALPADRDGSLRFQLARALEQSGRSEEAARVREEFERISQSRRAETEQLDQGRQITPP